MTYSELLIGDRRVIVSESGYRPQLLLAFSEADRHEITPLETGDGWGLYYETTAAVARDRLDVLGYGLDAVKNIYNREQEDLARELRQLEAAHAGNEEVDLLLEVDSWVLRRASFESWQCAIRDYLTAAESDEASLPGGPVIFAHVDEEPRDLVGFPGHDSLACLRGILEVCAPGTSVRYDLTGLVQRGYIEAHDYLADDAKSDVGTDYLPGGKVIVLTEGAVDSAVLGRTLRLLHSHLVEYFSFLDFETMKVPGGAGTVVGFLKAFIGAGVANRVVAILDNDTAARDAARTLAALRFPPTVRVLHYPQLELLRSYPTIGPTGIAPMDVNGLAGSIEMYFGEDVLRDSDGNFIPIQWRGYVDSMKQYQGELLRKSEAQQRYFEKLKRCEDDRAQIGAYDWRGMEAIMRALKTAYVLAA